jgi:flagellar capping protein FliD
MPVSDATFSMPGVASGIDWGTMADTILKKARKVEEPWTKEKDTLEVKINLYTELTTLMKTMRTAIDPLRLESTFKAKTAEFAVLSSGTSDSKGILTADVLATASLASHEIKVVQKAVAQTCYSEQFSNAVGTSGSFSILVGGRKGTITVTAADTLETIAQKINAAKDVTIDPSTGEAYGNALGVTASVFDNRLVIRSSSSGLGNTSDSTVIVRGTGTTDSLGYTYAPDAPSSGTIVSVKDAGGTTYTKDVDFTVSAGSDQITWIGSAPSAGTSYTVNYEVNSNAFTFTGDAPLLTTLGLATSGANYTAPQDAQLVVDGQTVTRSSNDIDDLITGVKLHIKGPGTVRMDIVQDAEKAVKGINEFVTAYNKVMDWINTRLSEKEVQAESTDDEKKTVATSEEFRTKFGALHGDSLLWQLKSQLRSLVMNPVPASYSSKTGTKAVLGTIGAEGLANEGEFRISVGDVSASIAIKPADSLSDIASRINSSTALRYDANGKAYTTPLATAKVTSNKLVITAATGKTFSLKDSSDALQYVGLNDSVTMLFQLGLATESTDKGKSGKLEFNESSFMSAIKENGDTVAALMTTAMKNMNTYIGNMVDASTTQVGTATGTKGRIISQIKSLESRVDDIDERISNYEAQLAVRMKGLYKQYSAAETQLAKLQQQASWLSSALATLNSKTSSSSSSSSS